MIARATTQQTSEMTPWNLDAALRSLVGLEEQSRCVGCAQSTHDCTCAEGFAIWRAVGHPRNLPSSFPIFTAAVYTGAPRALITAHKERADSRCRALLATALAQVLMYASQHIDERERAAHTVVAVVPVPTRMGIRTKRGGDPLTDVLSHAIASAVSAGFNCSLNRAGLRRAAGSDQVGLSVADRRRNAVASYRMRRGANLPNVAILVDDVVTTGATLAACHKLLSEAGVHVVSAVTLCATKVFPQQLPRRSVGTPTG